MADGESPGDDESASDRLDRLLAEMALWQPIGQSPPATANEPVAFITDDPLPHPTPGALDLLRSVRALIMASLGDDADVPAGIFQELRTAQPESAVQAFAVVAYGVLVPYAAAAGDAPQDVLMAAVEGCTERAVREGRAALSTPRGPLAAFSALAGSMGTVSASLSHRWAVALWQEYGSWAIVASLRICVELLEFVAEDRDVMPADVLRDLAVDHEQGWG